MRNNHTLILRSISVEESDATEDMEDKDFDFIKIPKPIVITAPQINQISHAKATSSRRQRRLRGSKGKKPKDAMDDLSDQTTPLRHAVTMNDIDQSVALIRGVAPTLQAFESDRPNLKDGHNRDLRTKRAWSKVTGDERKQMKEHYCSQGKQSDCHAEDI